MSTTANSPATKRRAVSAGAPVFAYKQGINMTPLERALVEQVKALGEVNRLSKLIGIQIILSFEAQPVACGEEPKAWLKLACEAEWGPSDSDYGDKRYHVNHEDDIDGYLAEHCQYALQAHLLIQERKEARKLLAIARRCVSIMGRSLLKQANQHDH